VGSVLLVEETGVLVENHKLVASHKQNLSAESGIKHHKAKLTSSSSSGVISDNLS
jgi:hypothetical protein